eukprot:TRINITY_DN7482_c0_g1_i1.p1 TRINITY_DN7482_c0_g1~~TRINITY_DN7482_c0_g1_i1.p1  ORF type:complete len:232 (+),score=22.87 TRINITY_DN7482_c0_g1_i1:47-742(+)
MLQRTRAACCRFRLENNVKAQAPFEIPYEKLRIEKNKKFVHGSSVKWYPEVRIVVNMKDSWLPENVKEVMRRKYPIFYNERADTFTVRTDQGTTWEGSMEHALDNFLHILYNCSRLASRDGSKFHFDERYYKYKMPLIFRHTEQKWLDKKRMSKSKEAWSNFEEPYGSSKAFKIVGGYQAQERQGGHGYHHAETLDADPYSTTASYTMDPHFINPTLAAERLETGTGVSWS